jgi:type III secretion protein T
MNTLPPFEYFGSALVSLFLATARLGTTLMVTPFFGGPTGIARRGILIVTMGIALPLLMPQAMMIPSSPVEVVALCFKEVLLGLLLAIPAAVLFWAITSAGELIDLQRGATSASVFNPFFGAVTSPTANLLMRFSAAIFFVTGGFLAFLSAVLTSFEIYPINQLLPAFNETAGLSIARLMGEYFAMSVLYAAPFLIVFLLIDVGLGLMNRFVPQLNIFFFSMPVKSGATFFLLIFYTSTVVWLLDLKMFTPETLLMELRSFFK